MARTKAGALPQPPLTPATILASLRDQGVDVALARVQTALAGVDQTAIYAKHRDRVEWEVWDGNASPVPGMSLKAFQEHQRKGGWDGSSAIYLGFLDGRLQVIQPFEPSAGGFVPMTGSAAAAHAAKESAERAAALAEGEILEQVRQRVAQG